MIEKELIEWRKKDIKELKNKITEFRNQNPQNIQEAMRIRLEDLSLTLSDVSDKQRKWESSTPEYWFLAKVKSRIQKEIRKSIRQIQIEISGDSSGKITPEMIERAKMKPIEDMIVFIRGWSKCLWHEDRRPSMKLLPDNKVRCYVCNQNHDAIDVFMILNNVSFPQAIRRMQ